MAMSDTIGALLADRQTLLEICGGLSDADWAADSGCAGWSVLDLVGHMGATFQAVVDPTALPDTQGLPFEEAQDVIVRARRGRSPDEVMAHYRETSEKAIGLLRDLSTADLQVPLGEDAGTYPASVLPAAFCFDHYIHIRGDLFTPRGPLPGPLPASGDLRLAGAIDWIEAALGQQNAARLAALPGPAEIVLSGGDSRILHLGPDGPPAATVRSDADGFVRWITQRAAWEDLGSEAAGDEKALAVLRELKVF
jgi:uncharacterized protein (TIGR03083 family)